MNRLPASRTVSSCLGIGLVLIAVLTACRTPTAVSAGSAEELPQSYTKQIYPLLVKTCGKCHGKTPKSNDL